MAAREMPCCSASCLNFCSQTSKLPVLRQAAGAAAVPLLIPASSAMASSAAPLRPDNSRLIIGPPIDSVGHDTPVASYGCGNMGENRYPVETPDGYHAAADARVAMRSTSSASR